MKRNAELRRALRKKRRVLLGMERFMVSGRRGEDDVEAFFFFEFQVALGVVAGELVLGEAGDDDGVEFEAFGLVDGEDGDAG